jgi:hypothetical protein
MPLECVHCGYQFKVTFRTREESFKFQEVLYDHSTTYHFGMKAGYRHVDEKGIFVDKSNSTQVKEEEKLLDKVSEWGIN